MLATDSQKFEIHPKNVKSTSSCNALSKLTRKKAEPLKN